MKQISIELSDLQYEVLQKWVPKEIGIEHHIMIDIYENLINDIKKLDLISDLNLDENIIDKLREEAEKIMEDKINSSTKLMMGALLSVIEKELENDTSDKSNR